MADDSAVKQPRSGSAGLVGWLRNTTSGLKSGSAASRKSTSGTAGKSTRRPQQPAGGIERAVVADAERQAIPVKQTAAVPNDSTVFVHEQPFPAAAPEPPALTLPKPEPQYFRPTPVSQPAAASSPVFRTASSPDILHAPLHSGVVGTVAPSGSSTVYAQSSGGVYPHTGAALYPCPLPGIPVQVGGTAIMNQALHPHEMLYAHRYRAMYPPYYYHVHGGWVVTPFGTWSKEDWYLKGTEVDVKYHSHISPFAHFHPPYFR